ncbi:MAG: hypothetical protein KGH75_00270 [Rhodospirillales bacterium]|nr:hypothetical protein [Rhodospirillales bacterium]
MSEPSITITVRTRFVGFHRWPGATGRRAYLADRHRHLFHVEVSLATTHDDREVEFHDLLREVELYGQGEERGSASCEQMARELGTDLRAMYPGRALAVSVFEDGEVGATLRWTED